MPNIFTPNNMSLQSMIHVTIMFSFQWSETYSDLFDIQSYFFTFFYLYFNTTWWTDQLSNLDKWPQTCNYSKQQSVYAICFSCHSHKGSLKRTTFLTKQYLTTKCLKECKNYLWTKFSWQRYRFNRKKCLTG